ncbi:hypothetical protein V6N12_069426 [Hibiscus sabdariffa]|uniref:Uncharacterized protein n=1 Tax=Hibiscus sabdariffa TaxID=183260 RepID=A0ABR2FDT2_9ROSI
MEPFILRDLSGEDGSIEDEMSISHYMHSRVALYRQCDNNISPYLLVKALIAAREKWLNFQEGIKLYIASPDGLRSTHAYSGVGVGDSACDPSREQDSNVVVVVVEPLDDSHFS